MSFLVGIVHMPTLNSRKVALQLQLKWIPRFG